MAHNRNIIITVSAPAGMGKTTMAEMLHRFLKEQGFDSTHVEYERLNDSYYADGNHETRVDAIKESTTVTVVEQQTSRPPIRVQG